MPNIFKFYRERIKDQVYRGKHFRGRLDKLAEMKSQVWPTTPGHFDGTVSERNTSETAFQRALNYTHPPMHLVGDGHKTPLTWKDIKLPIILSKKSRRRCVDLIGHTTINGTFLCELKYAKSGAAPPGNAVDYAIFEALLYYAIVNRDSALLDKAKIYHPESLQFSWKDVSDSRVILVLANDYYWTTARRSRNLERITNLVEDIRKSQDIQVLLCSTPNYTFKPKDVTPGRYRPTLALCAEEISAAANSFPTYRLIASSD